MHRCPAVQLIVVGLALGMAAPAEGGPPGQDRSTPGAGRQPRTDRYGDPLPPGALQRLGTIRFRHGGGIHAIAYSPDGKILASGGTGGTIRLWDAASGRPGGTLEGHKAVVFSLAFSPDGKRLVSAGGDTRSAPRLPQEGTQLILWDLATMRPLFRVDHEVQIERSGWVRGVDFSPNGRMIAMGCDDGTLLLLDSATGKQLRRLVQTEPNAGAVAFSPDSLTLAAGGGNQVRLWDTTTGQVRLARPTAGQVRSVAFSPDGKILATADDRFSRGEGGFTIDGSLSLWDVATGKKLHTLSGHKGAIHSVAFSPDGKRLASGGMQGTVLLWEVSSGKQLRAHQLLEGSIRSVAFAPDGQTLAFGSTYGRIQIQDVATGRERFVFDEHLGGIAGLALSPDGKKVATASADQTIRLWDLTTGRSTHVLRGHERGVYTVAFAVDGKRLVTAGGDGSVRLWDARTGQEERRLCEPGTDWNAQAVYSPSGKLLATGQTQLIRLWDAASGKEIRQLKGHDGYVVDLAFSPDERLLASAAHSFGDEKGNHEDWTVRVWDVARGAELYRFEHLYPNQPTFRPDGRLLAYLAQGRMHCRDVHTGKERPGVSETDLSAFAFSRDGWWLATAHHSGRIRVREWETGQEILSFQAGPAEVGTLTWAADGRTLLSANRDTTVLIWDLAPPGWKPGTLEQAWADLKSPEAGPAYRALWRLQESGDAAVTLLKKHLPPSLTSEESDRIRRFVADLDHEEFARREAASQQLAELGPAAEPALVRMLAGSPSAEVHSRVTALLEHIAAREQPPGPEELRRGRALTVLERIGTAESRQLLKELSQGGAGNAVDPGGEYSDPKRDDRGTKEDGKRKRPHHPRP